MNPGIIKVFEFRKNGPNRVSHPPNSVKKIEMSFVKKSELFERSEFSDFRKKFRFLGIWVRDGISCLLLFAAAKK
jgi:hypothetical protein